MQVIWYTAMSMDGRIAGTADDDDMSFLSTIDSAGESDDELPLVEARRYSTQSVRITWRRVSTDA